MSRRKGNEEGDEALIEAARKSRESAYAPYSNYRVGCSLRAGKEIYCGANVENASFGLTICAERLACSLAAMGGARSIDTIAVITSTSPPAPPCGMCLQTLIEFASDPESLRVILVNTKGERSDFTLADLIPNAFDKTQLTT